MYVKRERYLARIRPFYDTDLIKVLTGVRRSGKSVLLEQIEAEFRSSGFDEKHIIIITSGIYNLFVQSVLIEYIRKLVRNDLHDTLSG